MNILFTNQPCRCSNCKKEFERFYTLFDKKLCRECLTSLAKLIYITVEHFDRQGKEDKVLAQLEKVLEMAKNMTNEEYLELFERCKGMKDLAYEQMKELEDY